MQGRPEPVSPVPGAQGRGGDAESSGNRGDGEPALRRFRSGACTGFRWHGLIIGATRRHGNPTATRQWPGLEQPMARLYGRVVGGTSSFTDGAEERGGNWYG